MILREVRFRYWCQVCRHGSPGSYLTRGECEPWRVMHEQTNYHGDKMAHYVFHLLTNLT